MEVHHSDDCCDFDRNCHYSRSDGLHGCNVKNQGIPPCYSIEWRGELCIVFFIPKSVLLFNQNVNPNRIRLILDIVDSDNDAPGAVIAANSVRII